ncbi:hypothetical protein I79_017250 [Cricetulus griseus]|uniref:Uncharacterized protein n=1 Tax=Cricetulus griseus TaxID=10029 RepID=G3I1I9_CRIGR|nr:hypothetical protein I79_017250 [Cricetulus griseus]
MPSTKGRGKDRTKTVRMSLRKPVSFPSSLPIAAQEGRGNEELLKVKDMAAMSTTPTLRNPFRPHHTDTAQSLQASKQVEVGGSHTALGFPMPTPVLPSGQPRSALAFPHCHDCLPCSSFGPTAADSGHPPSAPKLRTVVSLPRFHGRRPCSPSLGASATDRGQPPSVPQLRTVVNLPRCRSRGPWSTSLGIAAAGRGHPPSVPQLRTTDLAFRRAVATDSGLPPHPP